MHHGERVMAEFSTASLSACRLTRSDTRPAVHAFQQLLMTPAAWLSFDGTRGAQPRPIPRPRPSVSRSGLPSYRPTL